MPFQYPAASKSILVGSDFYRITRLSLLSGEETVFGSLIPIDVGFNAIAVGPDSGFDNYEIYYPDPLAVGGIGKGSFSSGAPFIAKVTPDAFGTFESAFQAPSIAYVRPSRSLILGGDALGGDFVNPLIDIIAYTGALPPTVSQERSPIRRDGYFSTKPAATGRGHAIEGFGRKAFSAVIKNNTLLVGGQDVTISITGLVVGMGSMAGDPFGKPIETELQAAIVLPKGGGELVFGHDAVLDGYFDYYVVDASSAVEHLVSDGSDLSLFISLQVQD
jgi:hypothetical protein